MINHNDTNPILEVKNLTRGLVVKNVSFRLHFGEILGIAGVEGNALLASLPDLAVSTGSACTSSHPEASPVLLAMGIRPELAKASLRISLGRFTTAAEIDRAADRIIEEVLRLRTLMR